MIIQSERVYLNETFQPAQIEIEAEKIKAIYKYDFKPVDDDYGKNKIIPGLIDMHAHGFNGMDANYATYEGLVHWLKQLPKEGVTSLLVTTSTAPENNLLNSFALIDKVKMEKHMATEILGIHVEGPQISFNFKGAHNPYLIQKPDVEQFKRFQKAANGSIKLICIAPEMDENHNLIKYCRDNNVKVTIGHSGASYQQCLEAYKSGAESFTHTFNGMLGIHHREPGCSGAALINDDMFAELICDGVHVHFALAKVLANTKGKDKLILVTDAVQIKGLKPGTYHLPNRVVSVGLDGCGRLEDGRLAGSSNSMITMVRNCVVECGVSEVIAINAASRNPANFLGLSNKGTIDINKDADLVVIDENFKVIKTYIRGKCVY
ncbi:MAG: N-acetylglucosamine-6-phosphate deacetylase [Erysipelotrichaceae bacterium]